MNVKAAAALLSMTMACLSWAVSESSGLPDGMKPWWPSRYGVSDKLGTLNEIAPAAIY